MLVIRAELWPGGDEGRARTLGLAKISNVSNLADISDYHFMVRENDSDIVPTPLNATGAIGKHDRRQSVWSLVHKVLGEALGNH